MNGLLILTRGEEQRGFKLIRLGTPRGGLPPAFGKLQSARKITELRGDLCGTPEDVGFWRQFGGFPPSRNGQLWFLLHGGEFGD